MLCTARRVVARPRVSRPCYATPSPLFNLFFSFFSFLSSLVFSRAFLCFFARDEERTVEKGRKEGRERGSCVKGKEA